jgi:16S rRNA (uracil1498-N3)-methyltransferase
MKQFILPSPPNGDGIIRLYGKDYHYLVRVRRLKSGAVFQALLPGGAETPVEILSTVDGILIGRCMEPGVRKAGAWVSLPPIILFQGLPKGTKMDLIIRQAAEGGISEVAPFESEFSAARIKPGMDEKLRRWERIIREARQQSGSVIPTAVKDPCTVDGLLDRWAALKREHPHGVGILLHQEPQVLLDGLEQGTFHEYLYNSPEFVVVAVGPEGGFSPGEAARFMAEGFKPLVMGSTILRTETAALYATAAVRIILLESTSWMPRAHQSKNR